MKNEEAMADITESVATLFGGKTVPTVAKERIVVTCDNVSKRFGEKRVLHGIDLRIGRGEIVGLVGPSGCGKSTLLRAILGTHPPAKDEGRVVMCSSKGDVSVVTGPGRDRGIVYQRYSLFPHLTAQENVAIGLRFDTTTLWDRAFRRSEVRAKERKHMRWAEKFLVDFGLQDALERYPHEMSGGMCQRVAIAQALITKPRVLLMDEPFGALDEAAREEQQRMLLRLYEENLKAMKAGEVPPYTVVIVTHELNEALYVSDRVIGISQHYDWKALGHAEHPGATIVYDDAAPVCTADGPRDFDAFAAQRERIREIVFEKNATPLDTSNIRFWDRVAQGDVEGVMAQ